MPILKITSYRVGVAHKGSGGATRYLFLEPASDESGPGSGGVKIYFEAKSKEVGKIAGDVIVAMLPEALFSDMYHIVQTERPVFFMWQLLERSDQLESCGIATVEEPIGEGFRDLSERSDLG
ncbi:MAG: hypothetical protein O6851_03965 [Gemmatimonadetes bacterium]|jgi:hypothetical protein|nr:hypothetical protein [Gemmatimonadota bacterium]MCZ6824506.1 hypothetical protein [Gemmatimonadota bacterium]